MQIEWNKVTWYSKIIALALFIALPFLGFWYGMQYGEPMGYLAAQEGGIAAASSTGQANGASYYGNPAEWQTYHDAQSGFSIAYPIDFATDENYAVAPSLNWQILGTPGNGILGFTLTIPSSFEPQTNFADAKLTAGWSSSAVAVTQCLTPVIGSNPGSAASSSVTINGTTFVVFHTSDAGAGNYYETTSYRTLHAGACYAIEYTIHSSQIANYPASYNLHPFDEQPLTDLLNRIVGTIKFQ